MVTGALSSANTLGTKGEVREGVRMKCKWL